MQEHAERNIHNYNPQFLHQYMGGKEAKIV
jgi:hypothetical protein